ncbi:MAG TPA: Gfo/Idh/MocA family oxidoreductase [Candidatus Dormibacteraeota bacterium]|nr:Gfo/Idh/MocA family oxidoreductase [Candidatus Dormibacteraeota bacterium]
MTGGRIGWGVLGAANIARRAMLRAIADSSNGRLVAMASRNAERAREMLSPYPAARVVDSYDELLADPDIHAVYNPLPNHLHKEWTLRAFAAGKHVLCEKPLATDATAAAEMAAAAAASGKHLMEAFMYRFHPDMRAFIAGLHDPIYVSASFGFTAKGPDDIRMQAPLGGGALLDVGCYTVSVARWILGEPVHVTAHSRMKNGVDVTTSALLRFSGGATAAVWASLESAEIQEVAVMTPEGAHRRTRAFNTRENFDPYRLMVESFSDSVLRDRPVAIPLEESIANMRTLDRIRESAKD